MNLGYLSRRLLQTVPTVVGIIVLSFALIHIAPGDPVLALAGEYGDAAYYAEMRERFALDQPFTTQLVTYVRRVAGGDLGTSYTHGRPALDLIAERVPATLLLSGSALVLAVLGGLAIGIHGALTAGRRHELLVRATVLGVDAAPVFFVGQAAILLLGLRLGLFPVQGMTSAGGAEGWSRAGDVLRHLALPALALASQQVATVARLTRSELLAALRTETVRTARAKGLPAWRILWHHALPPALLPVLTVIGHRLGHLLGGAVIVEVVFAWPGLGRLLVQAVQVRDTPVLLAMFLLIALGVVLANLITDLLYARLDPRIRYA